MRYSPEDAEKLDTNGRPLAVITQTTLSLDDVAATVDVLGDRFGDLKRPGAEDICYATQNRQDAVKELIASCDVLIVVGSITSSNSNRLRELAERAGRPGYLIDDASFLKREWFDGKQAVGVTAGASAPEELVQQVVARLREWGGTPAEEPQPMIVSVNVMRRPQKSALWRTGGRSFPWSAWKFPQD